MDLALYGQTFKDSELQDDIRRLGLSKEGLIARQFMLGVVQTANGMPIYHEVFAGNTSEGRCSRRIRHPPVTPRLQPPALT